MHVGAHFDLRNRGHSVDSTRLHHEVLELCSAADSFGAVSVWFPSIIYSTTNTCLNV